MSKKLFVILIVFVLTFLWPLIQKDFNTESERLSQMNRCFEDKQIPCRWVPEGTYGYGSPLFNYLSPLPYYFGELIYFLSGNISLAVIFIYLVPFLSSLFFILVFTRFIQRINISNMLTFAISTTVLLLSHTILSIIFLSSITFWVIFKKREKKFMLILFCSLMISLLLSSFYLLPAVFERNLIHKDFLPIYAAEIPKEAAKVRFEILTGDSQISDFKQGSNYFNFKTHTNTHTIIRLSQHYFPNWKILIDGKVAKVEYTNNSLGLMTIILGSGEHEIRGKFFDTPIRIISNVLTLTTIILILIVFLCQMSWVKRWLTYYKKGIGN